MSDTIHYCDTFKGLPVVQHQDSFHTSVLEHLFDSLVNRTGHSGRTYTIRVNLSQPERAFGYPQGLMKAFKNRFISELRWDGERQHRDDTGYYSARVHLIHHEVQEISSEPPRYQLAIIMDAEIFEGVIETSSALLERAQTAWCYALKMQMFSPEDYVQLASSHTNVLDKSEVSYWTDLAHTFDRLSFLARLSPFEVTICELATGA
ncbi:inovirus-type Gp2 protein [Idiomarina sp. HB]|uniref:YagK/YfjJ domain-containing protein n=1 Tax=Idiomarina sp. HB TaxID=3110479 RepID=UPI003A800905